MPRQTTFAKTGEHKQQWRHIDADGMVLGRLAARIALTLMGKHRPTYTPHVDCGDFVIVTNAAKITMTGRKFQQRLAITYSGYPGGQRSETYETLMKRQPTRLLERAVTRMMPKTRMGRAMVKKLLIYPGPDHPHQAQQPVPLDAE